MENPQHQVEIKRFALGRTEVTQGEWQAAMRNNPSRFKDCGDDCPVEQVSWNDAQEFIKKLNQRTGKAYRLPSEAEWEYAARAGVTTAFSMGNCISMQQANYDGQNYSYNNCSSTGVFRKSTVKVGSFKANAFGLYDMHGNVYEWVEDRYHDNYQGAPSDGSAWLSGGKDYRVLRGGSWDYGPGNLRLASRNRTSPDIRNGRYGFRVARTLP